MKNGTRRQFIVLVVMTLVVVGASLYGNLRQITAPPPLVYERLTLLSGDNVCPGDTLHMRLEGRITAAPVAVLVIHNVAETATGRNVVADEHPEWRLLEEARPFANTDQSYTLPSDLPPGEYEFRIGAQGLHSRLEIIGVPFRVRDDCPAVYLPMRARP